MTGLVKSTPEPIMYTVTGVCGLADIISSEKASECDNFQATFVLKKIVLLL